MNTTGLYVKVRAGYYHNDSPQDSGDKKSPQKRERKNGIFMEKRSIVVEAKDLSALFRRDWELCSMVVQIQNTNERPSKDMVFSEFTQR